MKLEIIGFNIESCTIAQRAGADRIELCDNPAEGGTTPSYGFIRAAREKLSIEIYAMIRPRGGHFVYDDEEFALMKSDISICRELGCNGIVTGVLDVQGNIDTDRCRRLVDWAYPLNVTFHRAFDGAKDPFDALKDIVDAGFERILTSGQQKTAEEGCSLIRELIVRAGGNITIMAGAGIRADNLKKIAQESTASEFHSSARTLTDDQHFFRRPWMESELRYAMVAEAEVSKMTAILRDLENSST